MFLDLEKEMERMIERGASIARGKAVRSRMLNTCTERRWGWEKGSESEYGRGPVHVLYFTGRGEPDGRSLWGNVVPWDLFLTVTLGWLERDKSDQGLCSDWNQKSNDRPGEEGRFLEMFGR